MMHSDNEMVRLSDVIATLIYMVDDDSDGVEEVLQLPTVIMPKVFCTFDGCKHYKPYDDSYGVCQRDEIILDDRVDNIMFGCPDAE